MASRMDDLLFAFQSITRSELEHACAAGAEGMIVPANIDIPSDNRVKLIDVKDKRRHPGIRIIMRQESPFIQREPVNVAAVDVIRAHDVALVVDPVHRGVGSAGKIDGRIHAAFQHEAMIEVFGVSIRADDDSGIVDAVRNGPGRSGKADGREFSAAQAEAIHARHTHDCAEIVDSQRLRLGGRGRIREGTKDTVVNQETVLPGFDVQVVADNLAVVIDVLSLSALGAGEVEMAELALKQQEATIVRGAGGERAYDGALVIDPKSGAGNCSGDVQSGVLALRRCGNAEAKNRA